MERLHAKYRKDIQRLFLLQENFVSRKVLLRFVDTVNPPRVLLQWLPLYYVQHIFSDSLVMVSKADSSSFALGFSASRSFASRRLG